MTLTPMFRYEAKIEVGLCRLSPSPVLGARVRGLLQCGIEALEPRRLLSVYFVATTGSDQAGGTFQAPFQTIQRAASVAQPGDLVLIEGGTYQETVTPATSGTAAKPITFAAYDNQAVIISGADPIIGWSQDTGSIYQASMPWDLGAGMNQVFIDGQALNEARWPATSLDLSDPTYAHADNITATIANGTNASTATLTDTALTQPAGFWDGATISFAPGEGWAFQTGTVTDSSPGSLTFDFTNNPGTDPYTIPSAGNAFALIGTANALDAPGEFFRSSSGTLYVWTPAGDSPAGHDVVVQRRQYGFDLAGRSNIHLIGLTFFADTVETDGNSHGLLFDSVSIQYPNQFTADPDPWTVADDASNAGLALYGSGNDFKDSTLEFSAGNGVLLAGSDNTVQGSTIHDVDYTGGNFAAVSTVGPAGNILDNTVYNTGRDGIRLSVASGVQVINNVVHDAMLQTTDGGGIYSYGTDGAGSLISNNQVYNIRTGGFGGAGIYLDNGDSNWLVENNTVWNCNHALKLNPPNTDDHIESNILADSADSVATSGDGAMPGTVFSNNTFTDAVTIGAGATEQNDNHNGTFQVPADPAPNAALAAQHGSFTPTPNPGLAIAADEQKLQSDLSKLTSDTAARAAALAADKAAIKTDLAAATAALENDRAAARSTLAAAAATARATLAADKAAIAGDVAKIHADRGNAAALTADEAQLATDRAKLASDSASARATQRSDAVTANAAIAAGKQVIHALNAGTAPDAVKLKSDTAVWAATLAGDKPAIAADEAQLARDETG
jgi:hypothetical protein